MPRRQKEISCKESDLILLQRMVDNDLEPTRVQERAKMILRLLEGEQIKNVATEFKTSKSVVTQWRDRFSVGGPTALYDQDRPGRGGEANREVRDQIITRINEHSDSDPPLSAKELAKEFHVSDSTIFRILEQEGVSLSRQRKWYVGYTQAPRPKSTDMMGLYVSDNSRIMVVCTNHDGLLPDVQGALRTKNRILAEFLTEAFSYSPPDLIDLLDSAKEYRRSENVRHTRFDENQFLETVFDSLPEDGSYEYSIFVYQEKDAPLKMAIPNNNAKLRRMSTISLWNENVALIFDLLNASNWEKRTGADLISAIDSFLEGYSGTSEPFSWIKRVVAPDDPETNHVPPEKREEHVVDSKDADVHKEDSGKSYAKCSFEIVSSGRKVVIERTIDCDIPSPEDFDLSTDQFYQDFDELENAGLQCMKQVKECIADYLKACAVAQGISGKYKERSIEAEIGRMPVTVYGELLGGLRGNEHLRSINFRHTVGFLIRSISYRQTADVINVLTHREGHELVSHRTINDIVKRDFSKAEQEINAFVKKVLTSHGFSSKTGKLRKGKDVPEVFNGTSLTEEEKDAILDDAIDFVDRYNSKQDDDACKINLNNWGDILNEVNCPTIAVSPDGVEGKHQKIHRKNEATGYEGEKGGKTVNTSNIHLEVGGKVLALCSRTMKQAFILLLAVLLHNNLLGAYQIIIFTDGGRDIKKWASSILGFAHPVLVIDWYHLRKKCNEYFSMALKGGAVNKDARGKIKREFFARLWVGNIDGAIAYLDTIDKGMVKNHRRLFEMQEYLRRKRYGITCYALRRHFKLRMSSNRVEKLNDINTSARQKHKGKAWSHDGSYLLTLLSTIFFNEGEMDWYRERKVSFTPKERTKMESEAA